MRTFHSYGPVEAEENFCVPRRDLVGQLVQQLVGTPQKGGHYFTIWAARQAGKTWLMRQSKTAVAQCYGDQFTVFHFSMEPLKELSYIAQSRAADESLPLALSKFLKMDLPSHPQVQDWADFRQLFSKEGGLWDRSLLLLIDEFDALPSYLIDLMVAQFRSLYLARESHWLHGLALIGVRSVLGVESRRGSPFNVQRSLHVPNLTQAEVIDLYQQYQHESGQDIDPAVVDQVYAATRGQPGLVSWFGELLTEKYNSGSEQTIGLDTWAAAWNAARFLEPNNTVLNQIAKARDETYQGFLTQLFAKEELPFFFHDPLHSYLYMHGILDRETLKETDGTFRNRCRFSSPFIQSCLYDALSRELAGSQLPILALEPLDDLADVFSGPALDLAALLERYKKYLHRLQAKDLNPWQEQPRRKTDHQLAEAVGHFHLYAWLKEAIQDLCVLSPEFPTGNGKVDLHLKCGSKHGIIEVKSFVSATRLKKNRQTAAQYAQDLGLDRVTMAVFIPVTDESVLAQLSSDEKVNGVQVTVVMISWV